MAQLALKYLPLLIAACAALGGHSDWFERLAAGWGLSPERAHEAGDLAAALCTWLGHSPLAGLLSKLREVPK